MADADEDVFPRTQPTTSSSTTSFSADQDPSADLEDETHDYRFLTASNSSFLLSASSLKTTAKPTSTSQSTIPRRGEKDFEPNPTNLQSDILAESRKAMYDALSVQRVLPPANEVVGQYLPDPRDWRWDVVPKSLRSSGGKTEADMIRGGKGGRCVVVERFNSTYARTIGIADYRNWMWLLPEEALFLVERGSLEIRWPDEGVRKFMKGGKDKSVTDEIAEDKSSNGDHLKDNDDDVENEVEAEHDVTQDGEDKSIKEDGKVANPHKMKLQVGEMPMSLQGAYASLIGKSGLTLEQYYVYTHLRRLGYIVQRAPTWDEGENEEQQQGSDKDCGPRSEAIDQEDTSISSSTSYSSQLPASTSLIKRLLTLVFRPQPLKFRPSTGPLLYPGLYRNYNDVFRALSIIPYHSTPVNTSSDKSMSSIPTSELPSTQSKPPYTVSFYVYKPTVYRKSAPPPPDFRIAVLDARNPNTNSIPTLAEIGGLLDSMPLDELPKDKRIEMRLKHGRRNVVLAVVDCGLVSYLRIGDMCSGVEGRLSEMKSKVGRGGKRGGGGGWRGGKRGGKR